MEHTAPGNGSVCQSLRAESSSTSKSCSTEDRGQQHDPASSALTPITNVYEKRTEWTGGRDFNSHPAITEYTIQIVAKLRLSARTDTDEIWSCKYGCKSLCERKLCHVSITRVHLRFVMVTFKISHYIDVIFFFFYFCFYSMLNSSLSHLCHSSYSATLVQVHVTRLFSRQ